MPATAVASAGVAVTGGAVVVAAWVWGCEVEVAVDWGEPSAGDAGRRGLWALGLCCRSAREVPRSDLGCDWGRWVGGREEREWAE